MHVLNKLILAAAIVGVGACGSDDPAAPNLDTELDPVLIESRIDEVAAIQEHPAIASLLQLGNGGSALTQISRTFDRTIGLVSRVQRSMQSTGGARRPLLSRSVSASVGEYVPLESHGDTFVWSEMDGWVLSDRSGAPEDGIRFIIPGLDELGDPTDTEVGHLDVRDLGTATSDRLVATLVADGKTLVTLDARDSGDEWTHQSSTNAVVSDGVSRVELITSSAATGTSEADYRVIEQEEVKSNVGLGYRSVWVSGNLRAGDASWDQVTVGNATLRFIYEALLDEESGSYYESDNAEVTLNGRLYAREYYDEVDGYWMENAAGEPMSEEEIDQLYSGFVAWEWLQEAAWRPLYAIQDWVFSARGAVIR